MVEGASSPSYMLQDLAYSNQLNFISTKETEEKNWFDSNNLFNNVNLLLLASVGFFS